MASAQVAPTAGRNGGGGIDTGAPALGDDAAAAASRSSESVRRPDALQASVLDAQFLAEQGPLVHQADGDGDAIGGREQGDPGPGEGVEDRGASPLRPTCRQSEREVALVRHHRTLPGTPILGHAAAYDEYLQGKDVQARREISRIAGTLHQKGLPYRLERLAEKQEQPRRCDADLER